MVRILKESMYWLLILTGLPWVFAWLNRRKLLVLMYHGVDTGALNPVLNFDGMHVRVERFERQMRYLAAHYRVVALDQLPDGGPGVEAGRPLAAITFDDGYRNLYQYASPVLRRLGLPATVFVITDFLQYGRAPWWDRMRAMVASTRCAVVRVPVQGTERRLPLETVAHKQAALRVLARELGGLPPQRREALLARLADDLEVEESKLRTFRPLSTRRLREMAGDGVSVGGHGRSHDSFLQLSRECLLAELTESKRVLESVTGRPIRWLSFPYGEFSREAVEAAIEAGYRGAVTTVEGLNDGIRDPFAIRRVGVNDNVTLAQFIVATSGLRNFLKALLRVPRLWRPSVVPSASGSPGRRQAAYVRDHGKI